MSPERTEPREGSGTFVDFGWLTGFEPATAATTTRCSTYLSYSHHEAALTIGVWSALGDVESANIGDYAARSASAFSRIPNVEVETGMPSR